MRLRSRVLWSLTAATAIVAAVALATVLSRPTVKPVPVNADLTATESPKPVGWVFGRVVGFPGADRPLLPASGSFRGQVNPSSLGNKR